jgi:hypothetical protein
VFVDPAALPTDPGIHAELTTTGMSSFRNIGTVGTITTARSGVFPDVIAAGWCVRNNTLALGLRKAVRAELVFPGLVRLQVTERMTLDVDQARGGWSIGLAGRARLGIALGYDRVRMDWRDTGQTLAQTAFNSENYALAGEADIWRGLTVGICYLSRTYFEGETNFLYRDTLQVLYLEGGEPAITGFTVRYQIDTGLVVSGQAELTGWQTVVAGYLGTVDWHVAAEYVLLPGRLMLRAGASSLQSAVDPALREGHPELHNLYFLTAGAGMRYWRINADLGVATSYPLSGKGLNQNIVAFTLGYSP